jgi:hypothetical protein
MIGNIYNIITTVAITQAITQTRIAKKGTKEKKCI